MKYFRILHLQTHLKTLFKQLVVNKKLQKVLCVCVRARACVCLWVGGWGGWDGGIVLGGGGRICAVL